MTTKTATKTTRKPTTTKETTMKTTTTQRPARKAVPTMSEATKAQLAALEGETDEQARQRAAARIERLAAAKAEHAALKEWNDGGRTAARPATPHLDALAELTAKGSTGKRRSPKVAKVEAPAPKAGRGETVITLRSEQAGVELAEFVAESMGRIEGRHLVVTNAQAQALHDALVDGAPVASATSVMRGRRHLLSSLAVRATFPKVTDGRNSLTTRLVNELSARVLDGRVTNWSAPGHQDSTPSFVVDGQVFDRASTAAEALGVSAKVERPAKPAVEESPAPKAAAAEKAPAKGSKVVARPEARKAPAKRTRKG